MKPRVPQSSEEYKNNLRRLNQFLGEYQEKELKLKRQASAKKDRAMVAGEAWPDNTMAAEKRAGPDAAMLGRRLFAVMESTAPVKRRSFLRGMAGIFGVAVATSLTACAGLSSEDRKEIDTLEKKYGNLPGMAEYLKFMRTFLGKNTPLNEEQSYNPYGNYKHAVDYILLASNTSRLLFYDSPMEVFSLVPQQDVEYMMKDEKRREELIAMFLDRNIPVEVFESLRNSGLPIKVIAGHILTKIGRNVVLAKSIQKEVNEAIQRNLTPAVFKRRMHALIARTDIEERFAMNASSLGRMLDVGESDYIFRFFAASVVKYAFDHVLKELGMPSSYFPQVMNTLLVRTRLKQEGSRLAGSVDLFGGISIDLNFSSITGLFDTSTHEAIHNIAYDGDLRRRVEMAFGDDIRWLLATSLGTFNFLIMERALFGETKIFSFGWGQDDLHQERSPLLTHQRLRGIPDASALRWVDSVAYIVDKNSKKGGSTFGDEPTTSYTEGQNLGRYAAFHYGPAGLFLLKLYGMRHNDMSFARMELAASALRDILQRYDPKVSLNDLEKAIAGTLPEVRDDVGYAELKGVEDGFVGRLTTTLVRQGKLVPKSSSDKAMDVHNTPEGGIDFKSDKVDNAFAVKSNGGAIKFHIDPAMLEQLQNASGFVPVIINIQPMTDLKMFLGLDK